MCMGIGLTTWALTACQRPSHWRKLAHPPFLAPHQLVWGLVNPSPTHAGMSNGMAYAGSMQATTVVERP